MTNAEDRSRKTERLGTVLRRVAAKLDATQRIESGTAADDRREPRMEGKSPTGPCGTSRVVPDPREGDSAISVDCVAAGEIAATGRGNVIQLWPRVGLGRTAGAAPVRPASKVAPADFHLSSAWMRGSASQPSNGGSSRSFSNERSPCITVVWSARPKALAIAGRLRSGRARFNT
jgi:hypothetical protein